MFWSVLLPPSNFEDLSSLRRAGSLQQATRNWLTRLPGAWVRACNALGSPLMCLLPSGNFNDDYLLRDLRGMIRNQDQAWDRDIRFQRRDFAG